MLVAVYGNLIYDTVLTLDSEFKLGCSNPCTVTTRAGGIANFCYAAYKSKLFTTMAVSCVGDDESGRKLEDGISWIATARTIARSAIKTSTATVIVDKQSNMRTGLVEWGACSKFDAWKPCHANWHHIMYLDKINMSIETIRDMDGIVSVDFCDSNKVSNYYDHLRYVDYLMISGPDTPEIGLARYPVRIASIIHSPSINYIVYDRKTITHKPEYIRNLNVLGAGDYFAAYCIANLLKSGDSILEQAHERTLQLLLNQS